MVTTTEGMLHRVEGNTTHNRPLVPLGLVLVVGVTGLKHRLVDTSTTCYNTNHGAARAGDSLACARGELDTGLSDVGILRHDGAVVSRSPSDGSTVAGLHTSRVSLAFVQRKETEEAHEEG
jgi:hypothetical protein